MMSASSTAMTPSANAIASSTSSPTTPAFWERLWRTSGLQFVGFFIITSVIHGYQPQIGAAPDELLAFYNGDRTRICRRGVLGTQCPQPAVVRGGAQDRPVGGRARRVGCGRNGRQRGVRSADPLQIAVGAALAYSIAGAGNHALTSGLNDFAGPSSS